MDLNKNKISFLIHSLTGGGAEGVCLNLYNQLSKNYDVDLVVTNSKNAVFEEKIIDKKNYINLNISRARFVFFSLYGYIKKKNITKFLVFNYELAVALVILRSLFSFDYQIIARNINTFSMKEKQGSFFRKHFIFPIIKKLYSKVDIIINQCHGMKHDLKKQYKNIDEKLKVIYNPVSKKIEEYISNDKFKTTKKENLIIVVGRLESQKSIHIAIKAFNQVLKVYPNIKLNIIGSGSLMIELKMLVNKLKLQNHVSFIGFTNDIISYYSKAKLTLLTSTYEGFPNVLIESISLGTPVVSYNCPNGPDEIINDFNGNLVYENDPVTIAKAIIENLQTTWDSKKIIQSSLKFKSEKIVEEYKKILSI